MYYVYFYDLKPTKPENYNRLKRKFYYQMNKLTIPDMSWKTKSVIVITSQYEQILDHFFNSFKPNIEVYKVQANFIEEL